MLTRTPTHRNALAIHQAAFVVTARVLGVPLSAHPRAILRRTAADVVDLAAVTEAGSDALEAAAQVLYAGALALQKAGCDGGGNRDALEAGDLLFTARAMLVGGYDALASMSVTYRRAAARIRQAEINAQAGALVAGSIFPSLAHSRHIGSRRN
jgi:hypothetical protein